MIPALDATINGEMMYLYKCLIVWSRVVTIMICTV